MQQIIGTLLQVEIADKTARSIKYQMASARLPTAKELADFDFAASPVNEPLIQEFAGGGFLEGKRNIVLVGGTGTGKTHLAVAFARSCIRKGASGIVRNGMPKSGIRPHPPLQLVGLKGIDAAIAVSAILHRQADDRSRQCRFVTSATKTPTLGRQCPRTH